jgi:hypothetical protein
MKCVCYWCNGKGRFCKTVSVKFQVYTVGVMSKVVFCVVAPCGLIEFHRRSAGSAAFIVRAMNCR